MHTFYLQAIITASLGGILYGYDMGVISGALPLLSKYFNLTSDQEGWIVSLLYFGGGLGAATGGFLCDWFGRKFAILITDVMFGLGSIWLYKAESVKSVMIGRLVLGWAVAVSGIADVAYLHEISSVWEDEANNANNFNSGEVENATISGQSNEILSEHSATEVKKKEEADTGGRGGVVSVNEACISLGFLIAYGVAYILGDATQQIERRQLQQHQDDQNNELSAQAWRVMFAGGGFLALLQFVGMLCMPESPVWLHEKGRIAEARRVKCQIRGMAGVGCDSVADHPETTTITESIDISTSQPPIPLRQGSTWINPHASPPMRSISSIGVEMSASSARSACASTPSLSPQSSSSFALEERLKNPEHNFGTSSKCSIRLMGCVTYIGVKIRSLPSTTKLQYHRLLQEVLIPYKRQCIIALFLATSQQFCGHPSILNFSPEIFALFEQPTVYSIGESNNGEGNSRNEDDLTPMLLTVGIGVLKFLTTCIVILRVEKVGRRTLLLIGMFCIVLSLSFLWTAFGKGMVIGGDGGGNTDYLEDESQEKLKQQQIQEIQQHSHSSAILNDFAVLGIYGVAAGYAVSYGPLTWLLISELFPSSIRGRALGFATIVTYLAAGLVSRTFISLQQELSPASPFAFYWISTMLSIAFVWFGVPDTGNSKGVEDIESELDSMWFWGCSNGGGINSPCSPWRNGMRRGPFFGIRANSSWTTLGHYGSGGETNNDGTSPPPSPGRDKGASQPPTENAENRNLTPSGSSSPKNISCPLKPRRSTTPNGSSHENL